MRPLLPSLSKPRGVALTHVVPSLLALAALSLVAGCAEHRLLVVGDAPADVYVSRGTLTEALGSRLAVDPTLRYAGRTEPWRAGEGEEARRGAYGVEIPFSDAPDYPVRVLVQTARDRYEYDVEFISDEPITVYYPKLAGERAAGGEDAREAPAGRASASEPLPAGAPHLPPPPAVRPGR